MSEQRWHTLLSFPSPAHPRQDRAATGALPESPPDEAPLRDLATWTVPPTSDESRERLLVSARAELRMRALMAARSDWLRLTLPEHSHRRWPLAAVLSTLAVVVTASFWWSAVTVSADEALSRAEQAEVGWWSSTSRPIVHQRIELRTAKGGARRQVLWESWSNSAGEVRRFATERPAQRAVVSRYLETLARNGLDKGPPLSAVAFAHWRAQLLAGEDTKERVERVQTTDMGPAVRIHILAPRPQMAGRVVEASVLLRTSDWHPVEQVLRVQTSDGDVERFHLIEYHANVVSRELLPDTFFDEPVPPTKAPPPPILSSAELRDIEIRALFALHQLRADLGEQVDVIRRSQHIEICGVVDTADRFTAITGVMSQIPHVRLSLVQANRAAAVRPTPQSVVTSPLPLSDSPVSVDAVGDPPLWRFIDAYLRAGHDDAETTDGHAMARARAVNVFVQEVNGEAEAGVAEAWALRRLTERYPPGTRGALAEPSRLRLQEMTHDHVTSIRGRVVSLRRALKSVAVAAQNARGNEAILESEAPSTDERPSLSGPEVFRDVIEVERQLSDLLVSSGRRAALAGGDDEAVLRMLGCLLSSLTRLDYDLQRLMEQA
ncbi:MAG: hypothetical protein GEV06_24500 [Luteitalea sp.]|nr:hypothetical protein [Luteitalea sp.]